MSFIESATAGFAEAMGDQGDTSTAVEAAPETQATTPSAETAPVTPTNDTVDVSKLSPYAQNFLAGLPEDERGTAARHVSQWDQGFQRYAQERAAELNPYKQLGDVQTLQRNMEIMQRLQTDPHGFVQALIEAGYGPKTQAPQPAQQGGEVNPYEGLPPVVAQQLQELAAWKAQQSTENQRIQTALGALYQQTQSRQQAIEEAEADRALEQMFDEAHKRHGNFDDNYVMLHMSRNPGVTVDAAVQVWRNMLEQYGVRGNPAPTTMSASSLPSPAPEQLDTPAKQAAALAAALDQIAAQ